MPSESMILRYPHQLWASPAPHFRIGWLSLEFPRSQVLNAQGTNNSSAALFTTGSAKILPASLHPCHPDHSTKLANIGLPVSLATSMAVLKSPCRPSALRLTYRIVPSSTYCFGGGCHSRTGDARALSAAASANAIFSRFLTLNIPILIFVISYGN